MKSLLSTVFVLLLLVVGAQEEPNRKYEKALKSRKYKEGQVELISGQIIEGAIKVPMYSSDYIVLVTMRGESVEYKTGQLIRFSIEGDNYLISRDNVIQGPLKKVVIGKGVSLFEGTINDSYELAPIPGFSDRRGPAGSVRYSGYKTYYLKKEGERAVFVGSNELFGYFGFKKEFSKYFSDTPELALMIRDGELRPKDLEEIVVLYNELKN